MEYKDNEAEYTRLAVRNGGFRYGMWSIYDSRGSVAFNWNSYKVMAYLDELYAHLRYHFSSEKSGATVKDELGHSLCHVIC
jgi:hypothetical protein